MRVIPARIVPFRTIRTEYFVVRTLPLITSLNPIILVESNRLNLLRLWLCTEARVLRFDLLHLLRIGLRLLPARHIGLCVLLARCRAWCCRRSGRCLCVRPTALFTFSSLLRLLLRPRRRRAGRLTGNIRSRLALGLRFRPTLPAFRRTGLI